MKNTKKLLTVALLLTSLSITSAGAADLVINSDHNGNIIGGSKDNADNNTVIVSDGYIEGRVLGGMADYHGKSRHANNNTVIVNGGIINDGIMGGVGEQANGNTIIINGGTINRGIIAGNGLKSHNNTITIKGGNWGSRVWLDLTGKGGRTTLPTSYSHSNNTMNIETAKLTVDNIAYADKLYFYLPETVTNDKTVLTLNDSAYAPSPLGTDLSGTTIGVCVPSTLSSPLQTGDKITLIHAVNLTTDATLNNNISDMTGCSSNYKFTLEKINQTVVATVTAAPKRPVIPSTTAQPVPSLGTTALLLLMSLLTTASAWVARRRLG